MKHEMYVILRWNASDGFIENLLEYFMQSFVQTSNYNVRKCIGKLDTIIHSFRSKLFRVHLRDALDVKWSFVVVLLVNFTTTRLQSSFIYLM